MMNVFQSHSDKAQDGGFLSLQKISSRWRIFLVFAAVAMIHSLVYVVVLPPWQPNDEHGHFEYSWLVSQYGPNVGPDAISPEFQQRVLQSMYQFNYWKLCRQPMPDMLPTGFTDPSDPWLRYSRPQVGDEPFLHYLIVGGILRVLNIQDVLMGMYIGRVVSCILFALTVGLMAIGMRSLFPESFFMQIVPLMIMLFFPMLGQTAASASNDMMGVLTGAVFFITLIPIFRDGMTLKRGAVVIVALICAFLSKKTAWFLLGTTLLAVPIYWWTHGKKLSRLMLWISGIGVGGLILTGVTLALLSGGDANRWIEQRERVGKSCGSNRLAGMALEGQAALRVGPCDYIRPTQIISPEAVKKIAGQGLVLTGWVRSQTGASVGQVYVVDNEASSQIEVTAEEQWHSFSISHTVSVDPRWLVVRLGWNSGSALLFDDLVLSVGAQDNLLLNGSAEQTRSLLASLLIRVVRWVRIPDRVAEQILMPSSWNRDAWQEYARIADFVFQSFWGLFGSVTLFLPANWYWMLKAICLLSVIGNFIFVIRTCRPNWQSGYILVLMCGVLLVVLQTFLPMFGMRGADWMPQGRYMFSGAFAIFVLLAWGFYALLPHRYERGGALVCALLMLTFDVACLSLVLIPYFVSSQ